MHQLRDLDIFMMHRQFEKLALERGQFAAVLLSPPIEAIAAARTVWRVVFRRGRKGLPINDETLGIGQAIERRQNPLLRGQQLALVRGQSNGSRRQNYQAFCFGGAPDRPNASDERGGVRVVDRQVHIGDHKRRELPDAQVDQVPFQAASRPVDAVDGPQLLDDRRSRDSELTHALVIDRNRLKIIAVRRDRDPAPRGLADLQEFAAAGP